MKIYNQEKTEILENPDLSKGYLVNDTIDVTVPAVEEVLEQGHYETVCEYSNGGKDVKWVVDVAGTTAQPEHIIQEDIKVYIPYTEADLAQQKIKKLKKLLADEDYKVIKCYEAQLGETDMPYDIKNLIAQRDKLRTEINGLEKLLEQQENI